MSDPVTQQFQYPTLERRGRFGDGSGMLWLTAGCVSLSLLWVSVLVGFLLWAAGSWFLQPQEAAPGGYVSIFLHNFAVLLWGSETLIASSPLLPAIAGTALLVILMTILVAPAGVLVAIYLREYAHNGVYTQLIRIAVQNLAAVPSIIFGVFGLAFFVYGLGGSIDQWLYADRLPHPTFGTPGLLWSSLTMALLTLPVVIVATEEGLSRLPASMREGSYALGATRLETVARVLLPAALPSIFTAMILAVARAVGEVAPLMLVGAVKYAPTLPLTSEAPFLHLESKFMHLGYYVYDLTTHQQGGDQKLFLIAAVSALLVGLVMTLNITAIVLRARLRRRYQLDGID